MTLRPSIPSFFRVAEPGRPRNVIAFEPLPRVAIGSPGSVLVDVLGDLDIGA
jgi:hypothetical protein